MVNEYHGGGASICVRCPPAEHARIRYGKKQVKSVPVSMVLNDESLCPEHFVDKAHELGLTLDEAIVGSTHD